MSNGNGSGKPRGPMSDETANAVARMFVSGVPVSTIAATVGRTPDAVRSAIEGPLKARVDETRGVVLRETATHYFEMMAFLPEVRHVLQGGLHSQDERTRVDLAKWFHETLIPRPVARTEVDLNLSGSVNHDVSGVLEQIGTSLAALRNANAGRDPLARVRTGPEALSRPGLLPSTSHDPEAEDPGDLPPAA